MDDIMNWPVVIKQGWSESTLLALLLDFVAYRGLIGEFQEKLALIAAEENAED